MDKKSNRGALLFISVLLHSLLVLFPWQEKSRPLAVSSTPVSPITVVDASQLSTLPASESQPSPAATSSSPAPAIALSPPVALPVGTPAGSTPDESVTETSNSPSQEPFPETAPYSAIVPAAAPSVPPAVVPSSPTPVTPTNETKIAADWENLVGHLQGQSDGFESMSLLDIFNLFGEPGQIHQFFDENNQPKLDVFSYYLFPEKTPEQVLQTAVIPEVTSNTGFDLQLQENFTAGLAYQLLQGEMLRYLIIVPLNERSGSLLIFSDSLPGALTAE